MGPQPNFEPQWISRREPIPRRVVAYWRDDEGALFAGCEDGTVWLYFPGRSEWFPDVTAKIPQRDVALRTPESK